jgi:hypothetical protein
VPGEKTLRWKYGCDGPLSYLWITAQPFEGVQQSAPTELAEGNDAVHPTGCGNPGSAMECVGTFDVAAKIIGDRSMK